MPSDHLKIVFAILFRVPHSPVLEKLDKQAVILGLFIFTNSISIGAYANASPAVLNLRCAALLAKKLRQAEPN